MSNTLKKRDINDKKYEEDALFKRENFRHHMLRFFRERKVSMTRFELAEKMNVTPYIIAAWEKQGSGKTPNINNIRKLCKIFKCEVVDLYTDFKPETLDTALDDMIEVILADFHQNIRSNSAGLKRIALQEFSFLTEARRDQEIRAAQSEPSTESKLKEVELHQMRYSSDDDDDETED